MLVIEGVICDMDGTVVDSEDLHLDAWNTVLERHDSRPSSPDWGDEYIGLTDRECLNSLCGLFPHLAEKGDVLEEKQETFRELARRRGADLTHPAIRESLGRLRAAGMKLALATNSETPNTRTVLEAAGLSGFFSVVVTSDMVRNSKPHPDLYLSAASGLGVSPSRCAAVEDSLAGLESARAAGCAVLGVATSLPSAKLRQADLVFDSTPAALDWALSKVSY